MHGGRFVAGGLPNGPYLFFSVQGHSITGEDDLLFEPFDIFLGFREDFLRLLIACCSRASIIFGSFFCRGQPTGIGRGVYRSR